MDRKKKEDVDIFHRTLCCNPIREKEEEIEIFEAESEFAEEEYEEQIPEEEKLDMKLILKELECLKRRIQMMQLRLKMLMDDCPEEQCMDFEVLLNCSDNKEICALQKNQYKIQCQINELIKCCKVTKDQINDIHLRMCEQSEEIMLLQKKVTVLLEWKNTLDYEFGKCIERFEYLKHVKAEWQDVTAEMEKQKKCFAAMEQTFVSKVCFLQVKKSFIGAINEIKQMLKELFEYQLERFDNLEKRFEGNLL